MIIHMEAEHKPESVLFRKHYLRGLGQQARHSAGNPIRLRVWSLLFRFVFALPTYPVPWESDRSQSPYHRVSLTPSSSIALS